MSEVKNEILRGGQFLVKESRCEDIFTPEDFSEEQRMMKEAVMEFNDREIIPHKARFEAKDYALTEETMRKAGELGLYKPGDFLHLQADYQLSEFCIQSFSSNTSQGL